MSPCHTVLPLLTDLAPQVYQLLEDKSCVFIFPSSPQDLESSLTQNKAWRMLTNRSGLMEFTPLHLSGSSSTSGSDSWRAAVGIFPSQPDLPPQHRVVSANLLGHMLDWNEVCPSEQTTQQWIALNVDFFPLSNQKWETILLECFVLLTPHSKGSFFGFLTPASPRRDLCVLLQGLMAQAPSQTRDKESLLTAAVASQSIGIQCITGPLTIGRVGLLLDTHVNCEGSFGFTLKRESSNSYYGINYPILGYSSPLNTSSKG